MAKVTDTNDCGCGHPSQREHLLAGQILGDRWKDIVHEALMKNGAEQARAKLKTKEQSGNDDVVVLASMNVYVAFPREGESVSDRGEVTCACIITEDICRCWGTCDFDACCDEGPIFTKG